MKLIQRIITFALCSSALVYTHSAAAYLQLTYNSNPLHFLQGYLGGEPDDFVGSIGREEPPYPVFNVLFNNISDTTSTQTLGSTGKLSVFESPTLLGDLPISNGSLTLGTNGIPVAWNFSMQLIQSTPGVRDLELDENGDTIYFNEYTLPTQTSWLFESSYGAGTCNCEKYRYDNDMYIERPYYSWAYTNTMGFLYGADSSPDNWSIAKADVPEPKTYLLFVLGVIVMGVRKLRHKKII